MTEPPKVYIVIYSLYHHIYKLAIALQEGLEAKGVQAQIFQVQETLSDEVLDKMKAPAKPDLPVIRVEQLAEPDGIFFGIPTRFGIFPAQMKALLDASGKLWAHGNLAGKFVGTFFSTASQHGGQETTALNAVTYFAHHGMNYVPFGFANASMFNNDEVMGGSAYGSGTITNGDGSRQPSDAELAIAKNQGENFAALLCTYSNGKDKADNIKNAAAPVSNAENNATATTATNTDGVATDHAGTGTGARAGAGAAAATAATAATASSRKKGAGATGTDDVPSSTANAKQDTTSAKPKKKKSFWFCCGNPNDLD